MLTVTNISVDNQYGTSFLVVNWEVSLPQGDLLGNYKFNVYRSTNPEFEYEKINTDPIVELFYKDSSVNLLDNTLRYYYKIEAKNTGTSETSLSTVYGTLIPGLTDNEASAILYQEQYVLQYIINQNNTARQVKILLKRRSGPRCYMCWDSIKKQSTKSHCLSCYNVGFESGYYPPILAYVSMAPPSSELSVGLNDVRPRDGSVSGWMSNYPIIQEDDIFIDHMNKRYRAVQTRPTVRRTSGYIIRQLFILQRLPYTDIIYKYDV